MELKLPDEFREFLKLLKVRNVRYLLVGSWVTGLLGYVRFTEDIDVWIADDDENILRLKDVLRDFAFPDKTLESLNLKGGNKIARFGRTPLRIDIMTSISGVDFQEAEKRKCSSEIDGLLVDRISAEDFYHNKATSARLKDLVDLENLPPL